MFLSANPEMRSGLIIFWLVSALLVLQKVYPRVTTNEGFKTLHKSVKHLLYTLDSPDQGIVLPSYCIQLWDTKPVRNIKRSATEAIIYRWYHSWVGKYAWTKSVSLANQRKEEMLKKRLWVSRMFIFRWKWFLLACKTVFILGM